MSTGCRHVAAPLQWALLLSPACAAASRRLPPAHLLPHQDGSKHGKQAPGAPLVQLLTRPLEQLGAAAAQANGGVGEARCTAVS